MSKPDSPPGTLGTPPARRSPRAAALRFAILVAVLVAAWLVFRNTPAARNLDLERLDQLLDDLAAHPWSPVLFLGLWALVSQLGLPVSPLILAGGAVFGVRAGWLLNWTGAMIGATLGFFLARALGRDLVAHLVGRRRLAGAESLIARHGFWAVLRVRFLPVPFVFINYAAALAGQRLLSFAAATAIGLAPSLLLYTWFADALVSAAAAERAGLLRDLGLALAGLLALTFLPELVVRVVRRLRGGPF